MPRINRRGKKNGSRTPTKSGYSYRVYCAFCEPNNSMHPQNNVHAIVDGTNPPPFITCKNGHQTMVVR